jgi:hypothetical protein
MQTEEIEKYLIELGLPSRDNHRLPTSNKTFPDGAHFRTEELLTTVEEYEKMFSWYDKLGFVVNRITDVRGTMFDRDEEILKKLDLARGYGCEVIMGPGSCGNPFDISQQAEEGAIVEGKIRGMDQMADVIRDMLRAVELGCRGFLFFDEGLLDVALKMRKEGKLPLETKFKISANISVANAAAINFWSSLLGEQDEINPIRDLTLPMISAMREVADCALDIHVYWRLKIARIMEAPEIVRIGSPVYLKNSSSGAGLTIEDRCSKSIRVVEMIRQYYPDAIQSEPHARGLSLPAKPGVKW